MTTNAERRSAGIRHKTLTKRVAYIYTVVTVKVRGLMMARAETVLFTNVDTMCRVSQNIQGGRIQKQRHETQPKYLPALIWYTVCVEELQPADVKLNVATHYDR